MNIDGILKIVASIAQLSDVVMKLVHNLTFHTILQNTLLHHYP